MRGGYWVTTKQVMRLLINRTGMRAVYIYSVRNSQNRAVHLDRQILYSLYSRNIVYQSNSISNPYVVFQVVLRCHALNWYNYRAANHRGAELIVLYLQVNVNQQHPVKTLSRSVWKFFFSSTHIYIYISYTSYTARQNRYRFEKSLPSFLHNFRVIIQSLLI